MSRPVMQPQALLGTIIICSSTLIRCMKLAVSGYYNYHSVSGKKILLYAQTMYLCVLCGLQNKQRLFPYAALTGWFL
jgi:hypothetical protein